MYIFQLKPEVLSSLSHRNVVMFFGAITKAPDYCIITGNVHTVHVNTTCTACTLYVRVYITWIVCHY